MFKKKSAKLRRRENISVLWFFTSFKEGFRRTRSGEGMALIW